MFSPEEMKAYNTKAAMYREEGRYNDARDLLHHGLRSARSGLGDDSEITLSMMHNYGSLLVELDKLDEAMPLLEECLSSRQMILGMTHADTCATMSNLAIMLHKQGKFTEELALRVDIVAAHQKTDAKSKVALDAVDDLVLLYVEMGKLEEAVPLMADSMEHYVSTFGRGCKSYVPQKALNAASNLYTKLTENRDGMNVKDGKRLVTALVAVMSDRKAEPVATAPSESTKASEPSAESTKAATVPLALRPQVHEILQKPGVKEAIETLKTDPSAYQRLLAEDPSLEEAFIKLSTLAGNDKAGDATNGEKVQDPSTTTTVPTPIPA
eukprot:CAMPEP_0174737222 /NCGR_PEP_ID=MMETSP1094-20130205/67985_1 /TAXON_ID=156173 /ORGANISM="Chrysochromulina brevifilum, Strain UTEX LB 985" /LENGTH=324 /DNA_ID=CAMNT_0015940417 /DNA_START=90 /DNA_END=1060 /DNA_ORIENTATION=+